MYSRSGYEHARRECLCVFVGRNPIDFDRDSAKKQTAICRLSPSTQNYLCMCVCGVLLCSERRDATRAQSEISRIIISEIFAREPHNNNNEKNAKTWQKCWRAKLWLFQATENEKTKNRSKQLAQTFLYAHRAKWSNRHRRHAIVDWLFYSYRRMCCVRSRATFSCSSFLLVRTNTSTQYSVRHCIGVTALTQTHKSDRMHRGSEHKHRRMPGNRMWLRATNIKWEWGGVS